jgi:hypothetical protein
MGQVLAERLKCTHQVVLYDSNSQALAEACGLLDLPMCENPSDAGVDAFILAVPDTEVPACFTLLSQRGKPTVVFSVATNVSGEQLKKLTSPQVQGLNVKIVGHAGEMSRGAQPLIIVDQGKTELVELAVKVFDAVGKTMVADADAVGIINSIATTEALKAAVSIERALCEKGISNPEILRCAISHVAPGVMRAFSEDDLGPFARGIVCRLRDNS